MLYLTIITIANQITIVRVPGRGRIYEVLIEQVLSISHSKTHESDEKLYPDRHDVQAVPEQVSHPSGQRTHVEPDLSYCLEIVLQSP